MRGKERLIFWAEDVTEFAVGYKRKRGGGGENCKIYFPSTQASVISALGKQTHQFVKRGRKTQSVVLLCLWNKAKKRPVTKTEIKYFLNSRAKGGPYLNSSEKKVMLRSLQSHLTLLRRCKIATADSSGKRRFTSFENRAEKQDSALHLQKPLAFVLRGTPKLEMSTWATSLQSFCRCIKVL